MQLAPCFGVVNESWACLQMLNTEAALGTFLARMADGHCQDAYPAKSEVHSGVGHSPSPATRDVTNDSETTRLGPESVQSNKGPALLMTVDSCQNAFDNVHR